MKNLIIKTASITLACIIGALAIAYGVFAIFFPKSLAKVFDNLDNYALSIRYYEKQYDKSGAVEDLFLLCVKTDAYKDSARSQKYLDKFIGLDGFEGYCEKLDKDSTSRVTTEELLEGKVVSATYLNSGLDTALQKAKNLVRDAYTAYNPFFMLYTDANLTFDVEQLQTIKSAILETSETLSDKTLALQDVSALENIING